MLLMLLLLRCRGRLRLIRLVHHHLLLATTTTTSTSRRAIGVVVLLRRVSLPLLTSCRRRRWRVELLVVRIERVFFLLLLRAVLVFHF
jgi:hypothetical protein